MGTYPFAEVQSVYSTAQADWATSFFNSQHYKIKSKDNYSNIEKIVALYPVAIDKGDFCMTLDYGQPTYLQFIYVYSLI